MKPKSHIPLLLASVGAALGVISSADDTHVFETFDGLSNFLREHFEPTPAQSSKPVAANP